MEKKLHKGDKIVLPINCNYIVEAVIADEPHEVEDWQDHYFSATAIHNGSKYYIGWLCNKHGAVHNWEEVSFVFSNLGDLLYDTRIL